MTPWTVADQAPPPWDFPGKSSRVGCHFLLQGISPTQDQTWVSHIASGCFTLCTIREAIGSPKSPRPGHVLGWALATLELALGTPVAGWPSLSSPRSRPHHWILYLAPHVLLWSSHLPCHSTPVGLGPRWPWLHQLMTSLP